VILLYDQFEALPDEKKNRILNAALREFSLREFKNASTSKIAEDADISKGALFLYFGTKRQLYTYLYEYALGVFKREFSEKFTPTSRDPIAVLTSLARIKMDILASHPDLYGFFVKIYIGEQDEELRALIHSDTDSARAGFMRDLMSDFDCGGFRDDMPPSMVVDVIRWVIDGYTEKLISSMKLENSSMKQAELLSGEYSAYLDILRKAFYKNQS